MKFVSHLLLLSLSSCFVVVNSFSVWKLSLFHWFVLFSLFLAHRLCWQQFFNYIGKYSTVFERCFPFTRSFSVFGLSSSLFRTSFHFPISDKCWFFLFARWFVHLIYRNADSRHHLIYFASTLRTTFNFFLLLSSSTTLISTWKCF